MFYQQLGKRRPTGQDVGGPVNTRGVVSPTCRALPTSTSSGIIAAEKPDMPDNNETPSRDGKFDRDDVRENRGSPGRRSTPKRRAKPEPATAAPSPSATEPHRLERPPKPPRRRRIDPTTFEKQYTDAEVEFMNAIQRFKVESGRPFPTYREVLQIALKLGYRKVTNPEEPDSSGKMGSS
jgi:hypothetical protein